MNITLSASTVVFFSQLKDRILSYGILTDGVTFLQFILCCRTDKGL